MSSRRYIKNIFHTVKQHITARQAAEHYGLQVMRNGMACCPFHPDRHPSMKLGERFYCFGCHEHGDAIDFVQKYFQLSPIEAAEKLAQDFNLPVEADPAHPPRAAPASIAAKRETDAMIRRWSIDTLTQLAAYDRYLDHIIRTKAPTPEDERWHPAFIQALQDKTALESVFPILVSDTKDDIITLWKEGFTPWSLMRTTLTSTPNPESPQLTLPAGLTERQSTNLHSANTFSGSTR